MELQWNKISIKFWIVMENTLVGCTLGQLNPLHAKFFIGNLKVYLQEWCKLTIYIIPPHWPDMGSWNPSSCKTRTFLFYIVNIMGADVLATQGARASATMILSVLNRNNSVPAHLGLRINHKSFVPHRSLHLCWYLRLQESSRNHRHKANRLDHPLQRPLECRGRIEHPVGHACQHRGNAQRVGVS